MPHDVGTTAEISEVTPLPAGRYYISTVGGRRFRIERIVSRDPYLTADVRFLDEAEDDADARAAELTHRVLGEFREYVRLLVAFSGNAGHVEFRTIRSMPATRSATRCKSPTRSSSACSKRATPKRGSRPSWASCAGCCRSCARCSSARERRRSIVRDDAPGGELRTHQEQFFGKHFSLN